jgi:endoglucanase
MIGRDVTVVAAGDVTVPGLIAAPAGHVLTKEQTESPRPGWDDFFVDLGLGSRAEVEESGAHVGAAVVFSTPTRRLGTRIVGKAMDDRVALAVIDLLLERFVESESR